MKETPMRKLKSALLYTALAVVANTAIADDIADLREGDMRKLNFLSEPIAAPDTPFVGEDGAEMTLAAYEGQYVVLNFWATWCAPCRQEMPHLAALQTAFEGDDVQIVTIATGRNPLPAMQRFFAEIEVDNLPLHTRLLVCKVMRIGVATAPRRSYVHWLIRIVRPVQQSKTVKAGLSRDF